MHTAAVTTDPGYHSVRRIKLGENRGRKRVYLEAKYLIRAGFQGGKTIAAEFEPGCLTIRLDEEGDRLVSAKKDGTLPVIDIESKELDSIFDSADHLQVKLKTGSIEITPMYAAANRRKRQNTLLEASFFSGGGTATHAAHRLGYTPVLAIEIEEKYADVYERNFPEVHMLNVPIEEVDVYDLLPWRYKIGLLSAGIPCQPFSIARRRDRGTGAKRDKSLPPEHHELGDMFHHTLRSVDLLQPYHVLIEEVPGFLDSVSGHLTQRILEKMGYLVEARVLDPREYGCYTSRERAYILATTDTEIRWPQPRKPCGMVGDILDPMHSPTIEWWNEDTKPWWFHHARTQTAKGNGFAGSIFQYESPYIGTIPRRYFAQQGQNPCIQHPELPETYRWLTVNEVKRLHGIDLSYDLGEAKTTAGEVLGQGVIASLVEQLVASLTGRAPGVRLSETENTDLPRPLPESATEDEAQPMLQLNLLDRIA